MERFNDFPNTMWHIFPHAMDMIEREQIRIAARFGLTYDDLEVVEALAVMIANECAKDETNLFSNLTGFIGECKLQALILKICEEKGLNSDDFKISVDCDNDVDGGKVQVFYKGKKL